MGATATIRLSEELIQKARIFGNVAHRKPAQQIEYWVKIAQCAIDNPDMSFTEIEDVLLGLAELDAGMGTKLDLADL
ncbi:MAG: hypothetical protein U9R69_08475 [Thermodesulfobacteriota bacterium]|nr:hypothetical protein [Thermodesulfobacteriota bacterium]